MYDKMTRGLCNEGEVALNKPSVSGNGLHFEDQDATYVAGHTEKRPHKRQDVAALKVQ
jgi:hypothetical protein